MASIPEEWQPDGYDGTIESQAPSRPVTSFWLYYWLMTGGAGLLAIGLLIGQARPEVAGLFLLVAIAFAITARLVQYWPRSRRRRLGVAGGMGPYSGEIRDRRSAFARLLRE